jgi:hypothetical protein
MEAGAATTVGGTVSQLLAGCLVGGLVVYRVGHMLAIEDGPFDMFSWMRGKIGQRTWVGRGFHCILCVGWWLALPVGVLIAPDQWWLAWPAVAGVTLVLHRMGGYSA